MADKIRVGVIGGSAERGWALGTHLPALRRSPEYEITAVAVSDAAKARAAREVWGAGYAFDSAAALIAHPGLDLVVIAVPLPRRDGLVEAAVAAGRHVYCEWPLAIDATGAADLRDRAERAGVAHVIGLQSRHHPAIRYLRDLIEQGWLGEVLSVSMTYSLSTPKTWPQRYAKLIEAKAISRLVIVGGHSLDLLRTAVGDFAQLSGTCVTRLPKATLTETGEQVPITTPDQIVVNGVLTSGAAASVHIVTGGPRGVGYRIEAHGTHARLLLRAADDELIGTRFSLLGARGQDDLAELPVPASYLANLIDAGPAVRNVRRVYQDLAAAINTGTPVAPNFSTAVQTHRLLDAIELSARTGVRQRLG